MVTPGGVISTFVGNGTRTYGGDGAPPTSVGLNTPIGVAVDASGSVFIGDSGLLRVFKVANGTITTYAGNGTVGPAGDGGPAAASQLYYFNSIAVDAFSNIYIAEQYDVRKITAGSNTISTFAGANSSGFSGDGGIPASARFNNLAGLALNNSGSVLYLADSSNNRVRSIAGNLVSTVSGNGTSAYFGGGQDALNYPNLFSHFRAPSSHLATDNAGSLYFSDGDNTVRKLTLSSRLVSTILGNGYPGTLGGTDTADGGSATGPFNYVNAFTFDASGSTYFLDDNRVRKLSGGVVSTVANSLNYPGFSGDGHPAAGTIFSSPSGLARAANGDLYVADSGSNRVRLISADTGVVTTVAGTGPGSSLGDGGLGVNATLNDPTSLSLDGAGNLFICELIGNRIRKLVLKTNIITTVAGDGTANFADGVPATSTGLGNPSSIFTDQSGNVFVADQNHSRVRKVSSSTGLITTIAGNGVAGFSGDGGPAISAAVTPNGVTVDRLQNLYIADGSGRIRTTTVDACFFTFSAPNTKIGFSGTSSSVAVTATNPSCNYSVSSDSPYVTITSGANGVGSGVITFNVAPNSGYNRTATVNAGGQSLSILQKGPLSFDEAGFFRAGFFWVLDVDGNEQVNIPPDRAFAFGGIPGDIPITGDWNGDGRTKAGIYRPANGLFILDVNDNGLLDAGDAVFDLGVGRVAGDIPVTGDWNGDGRTKVGLFRQGSLWLLDTNGNQVYEQGIDQSFAFGGIAGDLPVVGDWSGNGTSKIGLFRQGYLWILDYNGNGILDSVNQTGGDQVFPFGGVSGDVPLVGDWNGDGRSKVGFLRQGFLWVLDANGNHLVDGNGPGQDLIFGFGGLAGDKPLVGRW